MLKPGTIELDMSAFGKHLEVATIGDKSRDDRLRWFGHVSHRPAMMLLRKNFSMQVDGELGRRGRPKRTKMVVKIDMKKHNLSKDFA